MIRPVKHTLDVWTHTGRSLAAALPPLADWVFARGPAALSRHPAWLTVLRDALGHEGFALEARAAGRTCGFLPLSFLNTPLFGRFLVSLPYLNSNGVIADSPDVQAALVSRAVELADELGAKHLELRHETPIEHPQLNVTNTSKVHMRLPLPTCPDVLWKGFDTKVRNQIRKGEKNNFAVRWGGRDLLEPFYAVLSENMRDLGTPVYGRRLFAAILETFPTNAELCVVSDGEKPIAAALLLHGPGVTEVPTASSLRAYNPTCANMLMYRHLLDRAVSRGQKVFDFGRSTTDGPTFKFKKQWGAEAHPAAWQYHTRTGDAGEMRPDNPRYRKAIELWQKLPLKVTQVLGPVIVRGIP
ncbi:MAG: FemAB family PEP-CTERM system-associated protein [Fimbriiglobus sp.]|jgi:FemAB-related protein (PEP-CTERM system-associated)|nr:FemAB family PEP-CTERM system-associated protein [Fimbriiglobus sp.]